MVNQSKVIEAAASAKDAYGVTPAMYGASVASPARMKQLPGPADDVEGGGAREIGPLYFKVALPGGGRDEGHFGVLHASRNRLRISCKGTSDATCWIYNGDFRASSLAELRAATSLKKDFLGALKNVAKTHSADPAKVTMHRGFLNFALESLTDLWPTIKAWLEETKAEANREILVSGHSLGGAGANLLALAVKGLASAADVLVACVTFGAPKVFRSKEAAALFTSAMASTARFVAQVTETLVSDIVTTVPPAFTHTGTERVLKVPQTPALQLAIDSRKAVPFTAIGGGILELHSMDEYVKMVKNLAEYEIPGSVGLGSDNAAYRLAAYAMNATMNLVQQRNVQNQFAAVMSAMQRCETAPEVSKKLTEQAVDKTSAPWLSPFIDKASGGNTDVKDLTTILDTVYENIEKSFSLQAAIRVANSVVMEVGTVYTLYNKVRESEEVYASSKAALELQKSRLERLRNEKLPELVALIEASDDIFQQGEFDTKANAMLVELRDIEDALDRIATEANLQIDNLDDIKFEAGVSFLKGVFDAGFSAFQANSGKHYKYAWGGLAAASAGVIGGATYVVYRAHVLQAQWRELRTEVEAAKAEVERIRDDVELQKQVAENRPPPQPPAE